MGGTEFFHEPVVGRALWAAERPSESAQGRGRPTASQVAPLSLSVEAFEQEGHWNSWAFRSNRLARAHPNQSETDLFACGRREVCRHVSGGAVVAGRSLAGSKGGRRAGAAPAQRAADLPDGAPFLRNRVCRLAGDPEHDLCRGCRPAFQAARALQPASASGRNLVDNRNGTARLERARRTASKSAVVPIVEPKTVSCFHQMRWRFAGGVRSRRRAGRRRLGPNGRVASSVRFHVASPT